MHTWHFWLHFVFVYIFTFFSYFQEEITINEDGINNPTPFQYMTMCTLSLALLLGVFTIFPLKERVTNAKQVKRLKRENEINLELNLGLWETWSSIQVLHQVNIVLWNLFVKFLFWPTCSKKHQLCKLHSFMIPFKSLNRSNWWQESILLFFGYPTLSGTLLSTWSWLPCWL